MRLLSSVLLPFLGCWLLFSSSSSDPSVCEYAECKETAAEILSNLNEKVDPCHDFYSYSCGGSGMNVMSVSKIQTALSERLQTQFFADDNLKNHGSKAVRQAKEVYDDCITKGSSSCESLARAKCRYAFVRLYMDKYFPVAEHNAALRLMSDLKSTFVEDIVNKISWIDLKTKETVLQNLRDFQLNIGYPNWLSDDKELDMECEGFEHDRWPIEPLTVNAQFRNQNNQASISKCFISFLKNQCLKFH